MDIYSKAEVGGLDLKTCPYRFLIQILDVRSQSVVGRGGKVYSGEMDLIRHMKRKSREKVQWISTGKHGRHSGRVGGTLERLNSEGSR